MLSGATSIYFSLGSLIAQRLRWRYLRRRSTWIQRSKQADAEGNRRDYKRIPDARSKLQIVDRIHHGIQVDKTVVTTQPTHSMPQHQADECTDNRDQQPLQEINAPHLFRSNAKAHQHGDIARLLH